MFDAPVPGADFPVTRPSGDSLQTATSRRAWWALCAAIVLIGVPFDLSKIVHHDVGYFIDAAGRMLDGARLYRDLLELNPPVMYALAMVPVALARLLHANPVLVFHASMVALAFGSIAFAVRIARIVFAGRDFPVHWLVPPALFAFLVLPGLNFGQREHILAMLLFPYLVAAAGDVARIPARMSTVIGLVAGVAVALKPHFALYIVATELIVLFRTMSLRTVIRPAPFAAAGVAIVAAVATVLLFPDYLSNIVPLGRAVYKGYESPLDIVILQRDFVLTVPLLICLAVILMHPAAARTRDLAVLLFGATVTALIVFVAQKKGWRYQALPALSFVIIGLGVAIAALLAQLPPASRRRAPALAGGLLVFLALAMMTNTWGDDETAKAEAAPLTDIAARNARGAPILFLSTHLSYAFPVINDSSARWPHHWHHLLPLPGLYLDYDPARTGRPFRTPGEMGAIEAAFFETVIADAVKSAPRVIFIDRRRQFSPISELGLDFVAYFSQDPRFAELLTHYRAAGTVSQHDILIRTD
jgi:hypothetical protein